MTLFPSVRIRQLLAHARERVPYYRRIIDATLVDIVDAEEFARVPIVTRADLQRSWDEFVVDDWTQRHTEVEYTSGTTGRPLKVIMTMQERLVAGRQLTRARLRRGLLPNSKWAFVGNALPYIGGWQDQLGVQPGQRVLYVPCVDRSQDALRSAWDELAAFRPQWIVGLPSALDPLARWRLNHPSSPQLSTGLLEIIGEFAPEGTRSRLHAAFGSGPLSQYGCQEVWGLAFECRAGRLHVLDDHVYLEVLHDDGSPVRAGDIGEVVITSLNARTMPFIRYRLGDLAIREPSNECACGQTSSAIQLVGGRTAEYVFGHPGTLGSVVFMDVMHYVLGTLGMDIEQYQVVQKGIHDFAVSILGNNWTPAAAELFLRKTQLILGPTTQVTFEIVDNIPAQPSGKSPPFLIDARLQPLS